MVWKDFFDAYAVSASRIESIEVDLAARLYAPMETRPSSPFIYSRLKSFQSLVDKHSDRPVTDSW